MTTDYQIKVDRCGFCEREYWTDWDHRAKQFEEKFPNCFDDRGSVKREYGGEWHRFHRQPDIPCFVFIADCGGDTIRICLEHFKKICGELSEFTPKGEELKCIKQ